MSATAANAGSLNAYLNPNCLSALTNPGGIDVSGTAGAASAIRVNSVLTPEKAKNWSMGANFKPMGVLAGLDLDVTLYHIKIDGVIQNNGGGVTNPNNPLASVCTTPTPACVYLVRANANLPITDPANATFLALVNAVQSNGRSTVQSSAVSNIQFIEDIAVINVGYRQIDGLDFDARYDFDLGDWGAWNTGVTGNFQLKDQSQQLPNLPVNDAYAGNTGGRLRYRGRLGWTSSGGPTDGLSITGFVNYIPHSAVSSTAPPACFWSAANNPATGAPYKAGDCYAGSPFFGPYTVFPNRYPDLYTFDLSIGYQTGTKPANEYLQNINLQFTVNDLFNKAPPFDYAFGSGRGTAAFVNTISPLQRYVSFSLTKAW